MIKKLTAITALALATMLGACDNDANVVSRNISQAADMFEVPRRIIFYNGITGDYILQIEGYCSIGNNDTALRMSVTCKVAPGQFKKHFLGLSDNVTFFAEHLTPTNASASMYRVIFKPLTIIPDIEVRK